MRRQVNGVRPLGFGINGQGDYYFHYDAFGDVSDVTSTAGSSEWTYSYEPFGAATASKVDHSAPENPTQFDAQYLDAETGNYSMHARQYSPALGQFTARDPLGTTTNEPYSYASNDPTRLADPTGLMTVGDGGGGTSAVTGDVFRDAFFGVLLREYGLVHDEVVAAEATELLMVYGVKPQVDLGGLRGVLDPVGLLGPVKSVRVGGPNGGSGRVDISLPYAGIDHLYEVKSIGSAGDAAPQLQRYVEALNATGCHAQAGDGPLDAEVSGGDFPSVFGAGNVEYSRPDAGVVTYKVEHSRVVNNVLEKLRLANITPAAQVNGLLKEEPQPGDASKVNLYSMTSWSSSSPFLGFQLDLTSGEATPAEMTGVVSVVRTTVW